MYLSRIKLDTGRNATRRAIASPQILHAAIENCFGALPEKIEKFENEQLSLFDEEDIYEKFDEVKKVEKTRKLWRLDFLEGDLYMLMVSIEPPDFTNFANQFCAENEKGETKDYGKLLAKIKEGQHLYFRFRGNPVHSVPVKNGERGKIYPHVTANQKKEWFIKKAQTNGFALDENSFDLIETGEMKFWRESENKNRQVVVNYGVFEGLLEVLDAALFIQALTQGIGRAKAYGCGMITVIGVR